MGSAEDPNSRLAPPEGICRSAGSLRDSFHPDYLREILPLDPRVRDSNPSANVNG